MALTLLLAACGPSDENTAGDDADLVTRDIAQSYAASRDLPAALAAIEALGVANTNQWLILVAEEAIGEGPNGDADALTLLAVDLGLRSSIVDRYAEQRGFTTVTAPTATTAPQALTASSPSVAQAEPSATPTETATLEAAPTDTPSSENSSPTEAPTAAPTATPEPQSAQVQASSPMNVRAGPSTEHPIIAAMQTGTTAIILAKNASSDWWQVSLNDGSVGWIYAPLVETVGNVGAVSVAVSIPTAPPALPTATQVPAQAPTPTPEPAAPTAEVPAPTDTPAAPTGGYSVVTRLRPIGQDAQSCTGGDHNIFVTVLDPAGNPVNGVRVIEVFSREVRETGQKGPGMASWDIYRGGGGQVQVVDGAGNPLSPLSAGMSADWPAFDMLRDAGYCNCKPHPDLASCQSELENKQYLFAVGHYVYEVIFRQN